MIFEPEQETIQRCLVAPEGQARLIRRVTVKTAAAKSRMAMIHGQGTDRTGRMIFKQELETGGTEITP
jgi:hypothetical protein